MRRTVRGYIAFGEEDPERAFELGRKLRDDLVIRLAGERCELCSHPLGGDLAVEALREGAAPRLVVHFRDGVGRPLTLTLDGPAGRRAAVRIVRGHVEGEEGDLVACGLVAPAGARIAAGVGAAGIGAAALVGAVRRLRRR